MVRVDHPGSGWSGSSVVAESCYQPCYQKVSGFILRAVPCVSHEVANRFVADGAAFPRAAARMPPTRSRPPRSAAPSTSGLSAPPSGSLVMPIAPVNGIGLSGLPSVARLASATLPSLET